MSFLTDPVVCYLLLVGAASLSIWLVSTSIMCKRRRFKVNNLVPQDFYWINMVSLNQHKTSCVVATITSVHTPFAVSTFHSKDREHYRVCFSYKKIIAEDKVIICCNDDITCVVGRTSQRIYDIEFPTHAPDVDLLGRLYLIFNRLVRKGQLRYGDHVKIVQLILEELYEQPSTRKNSYKPILCSLAM